VEHQQTWQLLDQDQLSVDVDESELEVDVDASDNVADAGDSELDTFTSESVKIRFEYKIICILVSKMST